MRKGINSLNAIFIVIAVSVLAGFLLLREADSLSGTTEYGVEGIYKLDQLNQELENRPQ